MTVVRRSGKVAGWVMVLALTAGLGRALPARAATLTDPLTTVSSSPNYTVLSNDPLLSASDSANGLVLSKATGTPANSFDQITLRSNYTLSGDFDVSVDTRLNAANSTSPLVGVLVGNPGTGAFADVFYQGLGGTVASAYDTPGPPPAPITKVEAPDLSVLSTFRLIRSNGVLTTEFRPAGASTFTTLNSTVANALIGNGDVQLGLFLQGLNSDPNALQGTLSNLNITGTINGLQVAGEEVPEPASLAVFTLTFGGAMALRFRRRISALS